MNRTDERKKKKISATMLKKVRQIEVRTRRLADETLAGSYHSVFKGRGMNFEEVREYVPGDDVAAIDWKVTARTGVVHVKKFVEERELTIMLLIDVSASGDFGSRHSSKRELMAELGSVLAFSAVGNNDKVGLLLFTDQVELYVAPAKGRSHILRVIREILFFTPANRGTSLERPLDFINRVAKRRWVVFLISDFCLPGDQETALARLRSRLQITGRRHDLIGVRVSDPREQALADVGWITLQESETGAQIRINTSDPAVRRRYQEAVRQEHRQLVRTLRAARVDLLELSPAESYLPPLRSFFRRRSRRAGR